MPTIRDRSQIDPDDFFAETRMSFGDHIEDLRTHLIRALVGFTIALLVSFSFGHLVLEFISAPVEEALGHFYDQRQKNHTDKYLEKAEQTGELGPRPGVLNVPRKALEAILGQPVMQGKWLSEDGKIVRVPTITYPREQVEDWMDMNKKLGLRPTLKSFTIMETVLVWLKVCLVCGLVLGSPWIFIQVWSFIAAGLYPHEKRLVNRYLPFSIGLFLAGVFLCQFVVMPQTISALLKFNEWLGYEPELRLNDWLNFALLMPLFFGVCFQTPLAMLTLERVGLVSVQTYKQKWRIVLFIVAVVYVIVSPTPDPMTMILFLVPMYGLYGLGILLCKLSPREPLLDIDVPESEEMVEV
jgi:sec-independent protein translocase protein TatC